jgi:hypothetical protein
MHILRCARHQTWSRRESCNARPDSFGAGVFYFGAGVSAHASAIISSTLSAAAGLAVALLAWHTFEVMMEPANVTIEILKSIRDEVRAEVAAVREQQVRSEIRVATELVAVAGEFRALREDLRSAGLRARLDDHEQRIEALENRTE